MSRDTVKVPVLTDPELLARDPIASRLVELVEHNHWPPERVAFLEDWGDQPTIVDGGRNMEQEQITDSLLETAAAMLEVGCDASEVAAILAAAGESLAAEGDAWTR